MIKIIMAIALLVLFIGAVAWTVTALKVSEPTDIMNPVKLFEKTFDKFTEDYSKDLEKGERYES